MKRKIPSALLFAQYQICKVRGHKPASYITRGMGPTVAVCEYCGTQYWQEITEREDHVPDPPIELAVRKVKGDEHGK